MKTPDGKSNLGANTPMPLGQALQDNIPGVEATTRLNVFQDLVKTPSQAEGHQGSFVMVDPAFFRIFDYKLLEGDKNTVLNKPNSVVLTPVMARKFFGTKDPIQQTLSIKIGDQYKEFAVMGIVENPPANSSLQYQMLIPFTNAKDMYSGRIRHSWTAETVVSSTYVLLRKGVQPDQLTTKMNEFVRQQLGDQYSKEGFYEWVSTPDGYSPGHQISTSHSQCYGSGICLYSRCYRITGFGYCLHQFYYACRQPVSFQG